MPFFLYKCIKFYSIFRFILHFGAEIGAIYGELILEFSAFVQQIFIRQISIRIPKHSKRMPDELISCSICNPTFFTATVKDNAGSYSSVANVAAPVRRWYVAYFVVQNFAKILKESSEKKKTVAFRKRISAKTTVFFGL